MSDGLLPPEIEELAKRVVEANSARNIIAGPRLFLLQRNSN